MTSKEDSSYQSALSDATRLLAPANQIESLDIGQRAALQVAARIEADENGPGGSKTDSTAGNGFFAQRKAQSGAESDVMRRVLQQQANYQPTPTPKTADTSPSPPPPLPLPEIAAPSSPPEITAPSAPPLEPIGNQHTAMLGSDDQWMHTTDLAIAVIDDHTSALYKTSIMLQPWYVLATLLTIWLVISV